jgi:hypothetical protein
MHVPPSPRPFGKFLDALNAAGVKTRNARGFWGGVTEDGEIVVTAWTDESPGDGQYRIWKPKTNHGGLKQAWDSENVRSGADVRLIIICQTGDLPSGVPGRKIGGAELMPGKWRIREIKQAVDGGWMGIVERSAET